VVDLKFRKERFERSGFPSEGSGFLKLDLLWGVNLGSESRVFVLKYLKAFENCLPVRLLLSGVRSSLFVSHIFVIAQSLDMVSV
jgi:hypothetical protein